MMDETETADDDHDDDDDSRGSSSSSTRDTLYRVGSRASGKQSGPQCATPVEGELSLNNLGHD